MYDYGKKNLRGSGRTTGSIIQALGRALTTTGKAIKWEDHRCAGIDGNQLPGWMFEDLVKGVADALKINVTVERRPESFFQDNEHPLTYEQLLITADHDQEKLLKWVNDHCVVDEMGVGRFYLINIGCMLYDIGVVIANPQRWFFVTPYVARIPGDDNPDFDFHKRFITLQVVGDFCRRLRLKIKTKLIENGVKVCSIRRPSNPKPEPIGPTHPCVKAWNEWRQEVRDARNQMLVKCASTVTFAGQHGYVFFVKEYNRYEE